jgi:hypothetical protein
LCDLLWSDPDKDIQGWGENDRGVSFTFGQDVVSNFLKRHDLDLICRAHQVTQLIFFFFFFFFFFCLPSFSLSYLFHLLILFFLSGCRGWLRILREAATGDPLLRTKLLRGV